MKQIRELERISGWKEKCDDISGLCDVDVFPALDYWAQEARLHLDFHTESTVWLDGDRMGGRAGVGVRERHSTARVCHGRSGTLLHPMWSNNSGAAFLPELRASVVSHGTRASEEAR
jgi:hypothetical protein